MLCTGGIGHRGAGWRVWTTRGRFASLDNAGPVRLDTAGPVGESGQRGARMPGPGDGGRRTGGASRRGAHQGTCSPPHLSRSPRRCHQPCLLPTNTRGGGCARTLVPPLRPPPPAPVPRNQHRLRPARLAARDSSHEHATQSLARDSLTRPAPATRPGTSDHYVTPSCSNATHSSTSPHRVIHRETSPSWRRASGLSSGTGSTRTHERGADDVGSGGQGSAAAGRGRDGPSSSRTRATPRTDPGVRNYRTGLLPWVLTAKRTIGSGCMRWGRGSHRSTMLVIFAQFRTRS